MHILRSALLFLCLLAGLSLSAQPGEERPGEGQPSTEEQLAGQFYTDGEWQKAADLYEKLYDQAPAGFYYSQLVSCYLNLKDIKAAEKLVNKQIRRNPRQLTFLVDLAYVYQVSGDPDKARKQYEKTLKELDPSDDRQVVDLSAALQQRKQTDLAIKVYLEAKKVPREYNFNIELANLYSAKGETDKMLEEYMQLLNTSGGLYLEQIQASLQDMMASDEKGEKTEMLRERFLKEVQRNPDNLIFSDLLVWMFVQKKDFESAMIQAKSIDKRLHERGERVYSLARTCMSNDAFETGKKGFLYVIEKGKISDLYFMAKKELSVDMYRKLSNSSSYTELELVELETLLKDTYKELGPGEASYAVAIRLAHVMAFYRKQANEAIALLEPLTLANAGLTLRSMNEVKLEMADIQLLNGDVWESTLTYSQVEKSMKTDTLGQEAKFRNARLAYYKGEFEWAKAQLDVLKAATSKLIANDALELSLLIGDNLVFDTTGEGLRMFSRADLWMYQGKLGEALATLDSLEAAFPASTLSDDILYRKANIAIRQARFTDAEKLLDKIIAGFKKDILADNALFKLAELNEKQLGNPTKAMELYKELMTDYPGSLFVVEARKRFRTLRGDAVQ
ncbi:MAG: hypothetical protein RLZZ543_845 [Bacteroidota bacterium]|jgi:tetratricopeptide (TPR) repeat protein